MSFEEIKILFEGYPYIELDIKTGLNIDQLKIMIAERFHKEAKSKIKQLTKR